MMRAWLVALMILAFPVLCAAADQSMSVGDEVVYSGGPGQPPQSKQTGMTFEVKNLRCSGSGNTGSSRSTRDGRAPAGAGSRGADPGARNAADLAVTPAASAAPAAPPVDLSRLPLEDLVTTLGGTDPIRRAAAAEALGRAAMPTPQDRTRAVKMLDEALADQDQSVARKAASALGEMKERSVVPSLIKLVGTNDDLTAIAAIKALHLIDDRRALPDLTKIADRDPGPVGQAAREAVTDLAKPREPEPAPPVAPRTNEPAAALPVSP